jgi:hypothetical protein
MSFINFRDKEWDVQQGSVNARRIVEQASTDIKASSSSNLKFQRQVDRIDIFDMDYLPNAEMKQGSLMAQKTEFIHIERPVPPPRKSFDPLEVNPYIFSSRFKDQGGGDLNQLMTKAEWPRNSDHASFLYTDLASSGDREGLMKLLVIATNSSNPYHQEAKASLMFSTNVDKEIAQMIAKRLPIDNLPLVAYMLSQLSSSAVVIDLINPYMEKIELLDESELTRALLGLNNLGYSFPF